MKLLRAGVANLPADVQTQVNADPQFKALTGALDQVIQGIGTIDDVPQANPADNTLLGGLKAIQWGLRFPNADCQKDPTHCGVLDAVQLVKSGIDDQLAKSGGLAQLLAGIGAGCDATCQPYLGQLSTALTGMSTSLQQASGALGQALTGGQQIVAGVDLMRGKISTGEQPLVCLLDPAANCGAVEALGALKLGIPILVHQISQNISQELLANIGDGAPGCDPTATLLCASQALYDGGSKLRIGMKQLAAGLVKLNAGGLQLADGAGTLSSGLGQISDGAGDLSAGAGTLRAGAGDLADGTAKAKDGSSQVADGANQLSDGLGDAADGSGQIADGLGEAANGAPQLVDGAQRLSTEGMGQLVKAGESTAQNYGEMYAVLQAGAERAHASSMAYGAPKGAQGLTAYSYVIKGDDGESVRNWTRGIAALAVLGLGAGAFALRRRLA